MSSKEHPNTTLQVNVSTRKNYTCGETPVATITFGTDHIFKPDTATVDEGQSILVVDAAGRTLTMNSTPDLGMGMGHQIYNGGSGRPCSSRTTAGTCSVRWNSPPRN